MTPERVAIARAAETMIVAFITPRSRANSKVFRMRLEAIIESIITLIRDTNASD